MTLPQRILRILESSTVPVSTPDIVAALNVRRDQVFVALQRLRANGLIRSHARTAPRVFRTRGLCLACKRLRVVAARRLCSTCHRATDLRATAPTVYAAHTVLYWQPT